MAKFKVVLTFHYDSEESIEDFDLGLPFTHITNKHQAIDTAIAELDKNGTSCLEFDVYDEDGEYI